jgi:hypothetical protein
MFRGEWYDKNQEYQMKMVVRIDWGNSSAFNDLNR